MKKNNNQQTAIIVGVILLLVGALIALNAINSAGTEKQMPPGHSADDGHNH